MATGEVTPLAAEMIDYLSDKELYICIAAADLEDQRPEFDLDDGVLLVHGINSSDALAAIPEVVVMLDRRDRAESWLRGSLNELTGRRQRQLSTLGRFAADQTDLGIEIFATVRREAWPYVPNNDTYLFREFIITGRQPAILPSLRRTGVDVVPHLQTAANRGTAHQFTTYMGGDPMQRVRENLYPN